MALMVGALYDALRSANVDDDKARKAAEEVADLRKRTGDSKADLSAVKGDVAPLKWMIGFVLATNIAILFRLFGN